MARIDRRSRAQPFETLQSAQLLDCFLGHSPSLVQAKTSVLIFVNVTKGQAGFLAFVCSWEAVYEGLILSICSLLCSANGKGYALPLGMFSNVTAAVRSSIVFSGPAFSEAAFEFLALPLTVTSGRGTLMWQPHRTLPYKAGRLPQTPWRAKLHTLAFASYSMAVPGSPPLCQILSHLK